MVKQLPTLGSLCIFEWVSESTFLFLAPNGACVDNLFLDICLSFKYGFKNIFQLLFGTYMLLP